jgi:hypothetical protein
MPTVLLDGNILISEDHEDSLRSDPELVKVVEEMGERAFGQCAKLAVTEMIDEQITEMLLSTCFDGLAGATPLLKPV